MIQNRKVIRLNFNVSFEQAMYNCKEQYVQKWPVLNSQKKHVHCPWNGKCERQTQLKLIITQYYFFDLVTQFKLASISQFRLTSFPENRIYAKPSIL